MGSGIELLGSERRKLWKPGSLASDICRGERVEREQN